jgi:hypothetical protein
MVADYYFARHHVSELGMDYGRMFGQRGTFSWSDVKRVRYASVMKWFAIELRSGSTVRVSAMLMGLPEFAGILRAHVPKSAIDDETYTLLSLEVKRILLRTNRRTKRRNAAYTLDRITYPGCSLGVAGPKAVRR